MKIEISKEEIEKAQRKLDELDFDNPMREFAREEAFELGYKKGQMDMRDLIKKEIEVYIKKGELNPAEALVDLLNLIQP